VPERRPSPAQRVPRLGHDYAASAPASRRTRIVEAMALVVYEEAFVGASVRAVCARAKVSRHSFYTEFDSREDCFLAVLDEACRRADLLISGIFRQTECWREGVCAALAGLLLLFDREPRLSRVWLVDSLAAGSWALERRERHLAALADVIVDYWLPPHEVQPSSLVVAGVMASVLGIIQTHLVTRNPEPLLTLLGPLMGMATSPYLSSCAAAAEIERGTAVAEKILNEHYVHPQSDAAGAGQLRPLPDPLRNPRAYRAWQCLRYLADNDGASNRQVATAIGISSHAQISTLLARLACAGLLLKVPGDRGRANAWSLTPYGYEILSTHAG
jgi:AcrR family transcriptional regulator